MIRDHSFDLRLTHDGETVRVTGRITPYSPATGPSMESAGGEPAEGGEIEDFKVYAEDGHEMEDADGNIFDALQSEICEKVSEQAASDQADAAEAHSDREMDR